MIENNVLDNTFIENEIFSIQEIILNSDEYFKSLLKDIDNARETIDLETYIYNDDYFGSQLADAICRAVSRKVKVRVLVDGIGTPFFRESLKKIESIGASVRVFHPIPFSFSQFNRANYQSFFLFKIFYLFAYINSRNHRKTCIIDGHTVYVGSINVDQRHLSRELGGEGWRDTAVKLVHVNTSDLQFAFNIAWNRFPIKLRVRKRFQKINLNPMFRLNYSRYLRRKLYKSLLKKITASKTRIWLTIAYFNPDYFILKKLVKAAKRGVDVKLILPDQSDVPLMKIVSSTFYTKLLKSNVSIYEYLPSVLHAKIINIEDWYSVGSSNLNHRSLRHDLEVDVSLRTSLAKSAIEEQFLSNIQHSRKISLNDIKKQPIYKKILGYILLFGKYFY
ncbi:MAG: cardiolipin synthase B [Gammaproteobacteria bacterium]|nr:cardiolipin synthase B [Gammaproteobacteria bacterium]MCW5584169.1 cardiolipin synthase B [Gammaproteobacteria bacterium]